MTAEIAGPMAVRKSPAIFTEKSFYLEEFYGKSLLFALVPPVGQRMSDFDSIVKTLRELRRNQTRCVVIVSPSALPRVMRRMEMCIRDRL